MNTKELRIVDAQGNEKDYKISADKIEINAASLTDKILEIDQYLKDVNITIRIVNSLSSTDTQSALSAYQGNVLKQLIDKKQEILESGKNIATINGQDLTKGGNILILGGSGEPSGNITLEIFESNEDGGYNIIVFHMPDGTTKELRIKNGSLGTPGEGSGSISGTLGFGSFTKALELATLKPNVKFQWILELTVNNKTIRKPIWHIGNKQFIDAIGGTVSN